MLQHVRVYSIYLTKCTKCIHRRPPFLSKSEPKRTSTHAVSALNYIVVLVGDGN